MDVLVVIDMQKDFVDGALGTAEAQAIVPKVARKIAGFKGQVIFTRDTHEKDYLDTQEGAKLPVAHCIKGTPGWELVPEIAALAKNREIVDKPAFGSLVLAEAVAAKGMPDSITLVGLCTDICVISNAMILKARFPEVPVRVDAACCAGVTPESHRRALEAMAVCQIDIVGEDEAL